MRTAVRCRRGCPSDAHSARVRRNANSVMNPLEILKLHNHRNFAARDVILNGNYSDVRVFARVRFDVPTRRRLRWSVAGR